MISISRRTFLEVAGAAPLAGVYASSAVAQESRKKVAMITTVWRYLSHAQHMGDRFLVGYPHGGTWHQPAVEIVSLYVDQTPRDDQSAARAAEFGFQRFPTIAEALCLGSDQLAVDAVLIIGEHGNYRRNDKGQILYPRFEFFQQVADVFRRSNRAVPVFNDKHLSYSFSNAEQMVQTANDLKFPLMAGSSLPVTWRLPSIEMPWEAEVEDALMIGTGGSDAMDFHALEAMQCMLERRRGGETGVRSVQLVDGEAVWRAGEEGRWSMDLLAAALSRSNELQGLTRVDARPQDLIGSGQLKQIAAHPSAYSVEYRDGTRATMLMLSGAVHDFTFAATVKGQAEPLSTLFYLPPVPNVVYSAELMHHVEQLFVTGQANYPVQRTLLVSGLLESCLDSRKQGGERIVTPHLAVQYRGPQEPRFAQA
jgi:hypothetical protein